MTKVELTMRIIEYMDDPYTMAPEDYLYCRPINTDEASDLLDQFRDDEKKADLEPDECLPAEVTPALLMEAYNCFIRYKKHEARVERLAEFITANEMVCEYDNYYLPEHDDAIDMIPVDFLTDTDGFPFLEDASPLDIMQIGANSWCDFNPKDEFCWFDAKKKVIHSTSHPFGDGILDAEAFAEYIMSDEGQDCFDYITNDIMDDDDFQSVFGCTREEYANE